MGWEGAGCELAELLRIYCGNSANFCEFLRDCWGLAGAGGVVVAAVWHCGCIPVQLLWCSRGVAVAFPVHSRGIPVTLFRSWPDREKGALADVFLFCSCMSASAASAVAGPDMTCVATYPSTPFHFAQDERGIGVSLDSFGSARGERG